MRYPLQTVPQCFDAFIDGLRLTQTAVEAAEKSPATAMYLGFALLGGAVGASVSHRREGTLVGVGLGLLFAVVLSATLTDQASRRQ